MKKDFKNPFFRWENGVFVTVDQTKLPFKEEYIKLITLKDYYDAIKKMKVRGAPAIGIVACYGVLSTVYRNKKLKKAKRESLKSIEKLKNARPTAVNIFNLLEKMKVIIENFNGNDYLLFRRKLEDFCEKTYKYEVYTCDRMADYGYRLIKNGMNVLTHCNTGMLATSGIGTALGVILRAFQKGVKFHLFIPETRPLLQGGRLTVFEAEKFKIPYTLITDNTRGYLFSRNKIDITFVGADRIALNGDTANKIGTCESAILSYHFKKPFYVVAPTTTFDGNITDGDKIIIEERKKEEVLSINGKRISIAKNVFNPAFDITPSKYITGIITEKGIIKPEKGCIKNIL
ncbi:MAG: S-methyl-5-thioribose-1-phosphate isomerase [bacterium]|uniref:Methylthioribose-1-phosphate isomerase n=2 Tax=Bacteria candidate phyla TaxID=1783234 RepID=A0A101I1L8_UNCT6|nr:MAG: Methylthioribose-1-phosphate isomerase [candidate division TA06 bacterium 32_111]KUK87347.1 MAG: Methylthioribose-1-phosphate isomerase [candidate division TA06 bacterium 34_109]MDI6701199.1 S-methyl-5-thioribose-1-phosphate isomerase [bacterium]HAF07820.1 S-methyl-5-thioribose-1-phosphate isomerase [candidate division WOR-3 bacterium]HCP17338.1 S-methyl-5-thioribose-1-phosphate isomerase [candidate division WOR-3 bacterium]